MRGFGGEQIERELLGEADLENIKRFPEYLKYREAMEVARKLQPWADPKDPQPDFAYEVMLQLEELLDAEDEVSFYTAVGTILDVKHGVDAWFEFKDRNRVTLDVTTARHGSKGRTKADIDFPVPSDGLDRQVDEEQFLNYARALAERIVQFLTEGQQERVVYQAS